MSEGNAKREKAYKRGHTGERLAAFLLRLKGYRILQRRFKAPVGEIDLIARKRDQIVFVEVKAREKLEDGLLAITGKNRRRILQAAKSYMAKNPSIAAFPMRFDAVIILPFFFMKHIPDAWRPGLA